MSDIASEDMGPWLSDSDLDFVRRKVPMLYVDVVPVRTNEQGEVESIGLLLCGKDEGITRALVSGRVLYHEAIRDALVRHLEKDLGPMCLAQIPPTVTPFTIAEYFPTPGYAKYDERQHAVSLCYVIPVMGECNPSADMLDVSWFTPGEVRTRELQAEMSKSHAQILRQALAHVGHA